MDNDNRLVTVIIPVFNTMEYLDTCVESILVQTYRPIEIILVDDGSTDGSGQLCDSLAKQNAGIRVIHQKNGGSSRARNAGLDIARGKYVSFIDSDDYVHPSFIRSLVDGMETAGCLLAEVRRMVVTEDSQALPNPDGVGEYELVDFKEAVRLLLEEKIRSQIINKLYDGETICQYHLRFDERLTYLEDLDFNLQYLMYHDGKIALNRSVLYFYRDRAGSLTRNGLLEFDGSLLNAFRYLSEKYRKDPECPAETKEILTSLYASNMVYAFYRGVACGKSYSRTEVQTFVRQFSGVPFRLRGKQRLEYWLMAHTPGVAYILSRINMRVKSIRYPDSL